MPFPLLQNRQSEIYTLYASWEQLLLNQSQTLSCTDSVDAALKIKDLVYNSKDAFFKQFFFQEDLPRCLASSTLNELKERISHLEKQLLNQISFSTHLITSIIRLFTHNHYANTAHFLVESQDQALSPYSTPLEDSYLKFSKTLAATGLFALDLFQWRAIGFSHHLLTAISHQIMPSADQWIPVFQLFRADEKTAMRCMPYIHSLFELIAFVGISSYSLGFSLRSASQITLSYTLGIATSYAAAKAVDALYRKDAPSYPLVRGIAQWVAFPLTVTQLVPLISQYLSIPTNVLADEATCFANKELCKVEARQVLGLPGNATLHEVSKAFHTLAMDYHPDRNPAGSEMYGRFAEAKKYCFDLEK